MVYCKYIQSSLQNKISNLPDCSKILPKFTYAKEGKLAGQTQVLPVRVHGPALILKTVRFSEELIYKTKVARGQDPKFLFICYFQKCLLNQYWYAGSLPLTLTYLLSNVTQHPLKNTLRPRQNGQYFPDNIFKCIFLNEKVCILINNSLKFVPKGPINNIPAFVKIMAWCWPGDKPLSEPMMVLKITDTYMWYSASMS